MSLYLITGSAGTGKSTLCRVLKDFGYEAYDTDDDGLARWQHKATGYMHPKSSVKAAQRTAEFIAEHSWNVPREMLENLKAKAGTSPIFICGSLGNEDELRDIFTAIFVLYVDDKTLRQRLATRSDNDWGEQPHELEQTLAHHHAAYQKHMRRGDAMLDATKPIEETAREVIRSIV